MSKRGLVTTAVILLIALVFPVSSPAAGVLKSTGSMTTRLSTLTTTDAYAMTGPFDVHWQWSATAADGSAPAKGWMKYTVTKIEQDGTRTPVVSRTWPVTGVEALDQKTVELTVPGSSYHFPNWASSVLRATDNGKSGDVLEQRCYAHSMPAPAPPVFHVIADSGSIRNR